MMMNKKPRTYKSPILSELIQNISKEELEKLVLKNTVLEIAKMFGVTYNSISKRCKLLKIEFTPIVKNRKSKNVNPV